MEARRPSAAGSASSSVYSTQTLPAPVPVAETARTSQTSFASRAWIFGKVPSYRDSERRRRPSRLEPVVLRDSVAYPSASSFEATIEKGTARWGRRASTKPRLVDLDLAGLRRKVKRVTMLRRGSEQRGDLGAGTTPATLREAFAGQKVELGHRPEPEVEEKREREMGRMQTQTQTQPPAQEYAPESIRFSPPTDLQLTTMMYHETHNDIIRRSRTDSPTAREPEVPFRDKIRGKHFSRTAGNLGQELASYSREKRRGCTTAQCVVI